jgi:hypothetical protein
MDFIACGHPSASSYTGEARTMRPENPVGRGAAFLAAALCLAGALWIAAAGCAAQGRPSVGSAPAGNAGNTGNAGNAGLTGVAGASAGASGSSVTGAAGASTGAAGSSMTGSAGGPAPGAAGTAPWGAGGTVDQGLLFTDAAAVSTAPADAGTTSGADTAPADGGNATPGDGNTSTCHVGGMNYILVFTQKGTDVTMVVTATNCPAGSHTIQIHGGFSCDNAGTEGGVWDGARGAGIPALTCANNKGTLTYTRSGADPTAAWTVGDHSTKTDVTLHPMSVDTSCGTFF